MRRIVTKCTFQRCFGGQWPKEGQKSVLRIHRRWSSTSSKHVSMLFNTCLVHNHKHLHVHKTLLSERHTDRFEASTHMIWGVHDIVMKKQPQKQIPLCSSCWLACSARHSFLAASIAGLQTYSRLLGFSQCGSF